MPATNPNTLGVLQALQGLIVANSGTTFAALAVADATRYGVARAVFIGAPKDFKDGALPQCQIIPEDNDVTVIGAHGRVADVLTVRLRIVVDFTDWWAAEQSILMIRDLLLPLLATHLRAGAAPSSPLAALDYAASTDHAAFTTITVAGVWYRTWSCLLRLEQIFVPTGGLVG